MYTGPGAKLVGDALMNVGQQIHQVNVARQVASALAEYKMNATDFLAKMQNADPSKVDFKQEYQKFMAQQGGLAQGVSRDASNVITNRLKGYAASTYGDTMRMEIRNTRAMALAEIPDVMDGLIREQAQAEMVGDTERARRAEDDLTNYLKALEPAIAPWEKIKIESARKDMLGKTREEVAENAVVGLINRGDLVNAKAVLDNSKLPEKKKYTLNNAIKAQSKKTETGSTLRKNMIKEGYAKQILKTTRDGGILNEPEADDETRDFIDMINIAKANGIDNMGLDPPPSYYVLKEKLDSLNDTVTYRDIVKVQAAGTSTDLVLEMEDQLVENQKLMPHKPEYKAIRSLIKADFKDVDTVIEAKYNWKSKPEIMDTLLREMDELEVYYETKLKKDLIDGKPYDEIRKDLNKAFEHTHKDVIEKGRWFTGFFKPKVRELDKKIQFQSGTAQATELRRAQGALHLIQSGGEHEDLIKAMVQADFFTKDIADLKPIVKEKREQAEGVTEHGEAPSGRTKLDGYYGKLPLHKDGVRVGYATEYSIGSSDVVPGQETEIPTLVPTLDDLELINMIEDIIPNRKPIPKSITDKAVEHARMRIKAGKSPFWNKKDDSNE
jgi:hypothetical protein